jgi:drug/metabolite transporter (DMT)-like permease
MRNIVLKTTGSVLGLFGLLTLFVSSSILFDLFEVREKLNHYILFVVCANFICAFLYLFASYCFFTKNKQATIALFIAVAILLATYISLLIYVQTGRIFEMRTVKAMLFRTSITIVFAGISWYFLTRTRLTESPDLN